MYRKTHHHPPNDSSNKPALPIEDKFGQFLLPLDSFVHKMYDCCVHELHGPDLETTVRNDGEDENLPADWIWTVFRDALSALAALHKQHIVHGSIDLMDSLIMTYPKVDATNENSVFDHYGWPSDAGFKFNATGTGSSSKFHNLNFQLKLQSFDASFDVRQGAVDLSRYLRGDTPPPELAFKHQVGPETDIWYLATMMTNFIAGREHWNLIFQMDKPHLYRQQLLEVQRIVGPMPEEYAEELYKDQDSVYRPDIYDPDSEPTTLVEQVMGEWWYRKEREEQAIVKYGCRDFSPHEARSAVDLLSHMLDLDASKRYTAEQALQHDFFRVARPA